MNILTVAKYVISKSPNVTHLKLQKLLYYSKVWSLVGGYAFVKSPFKKWTWGPVNVDVWNQFKMYGAAQLPKSSEPNLLMSKGQKAVLDFVVDCYSPLDALTLSAMTHQDMPWKKTPKNQVIPEKLMKQYYATLPFASNFPLSSNKPFFPVETDAHYAYIFDMTPGEAKGIVFPSFEDYKNQFSATQKKIKQIISEFELSELSQ